MRCGRGLLQLCGRGALFVSSPSVPTKGWLVGVCTANPGRHQAKRRATRATALGLACAGLIGDAPLAAVRARIMRPPGSSSRTHPSARLHACLKLRQMGCGRGGRVASSHQGHRTALHRCGRLIWCVPNQAWSEWTRHIGIASCTRRTSARRCRALVARRRIRPWRCCSGTRQGGDSHGAGQDVNHRRRIKEKQNLSTAETFSESCNTRAHGASSSLGFTEQPLTARSDNDLAPD